MARTSLRQILRSGVLGELSTGPALVLLAIADHADNRNEAWPSQATLAQEAGMSPLGVRKAIGALVDLGFLEILDPGGPRRSARYRVTVGHYLRATA